MKLRTLLLAFGVVALVVTVLMGLLVWRAAVMTAKQDAEQLRARTAARQMSSLLVLTQEYARSFDDRAAQQWSDKFETLVHQFESGNSDKAEKGDKDLRMESLALAAGQVRQQFGALVSIGSMEMSPFNQRRRDLLLDQVLADVQSLTDEIFRWTREAASAEQKADAEFIRTMLIAFGVIVALMTAQSALMARKVLRHLGRIEQTTMQLAAGDLSARVGLRTRDELGQVATRFDEMADALVRRDTELNQALARLADSERFVRNITDNLPVRIAYVDLEYRYRFVNRAHTERFGRPREEIIGRTRSEMTNGVTDATVEPRLAQALAGHPQTYETEEIVDGETRCVEGRVTPDFDADGRVVGLFTTGIDVTERKANERALRELTEIFDNTTDFVVQTDRRGLITYLNRSARRVLGFSQDEPLGGRSFMEFNTPKTIQRIVEEITPLVNAGGVWLGENEVFVQGQRVLPVSHMVIGHTDEAGRVVRYSGVMRDISADVAAREQLARQTATLTSITEAIPAMVAVLGTDQRYRFVNTAFERWRATPRSEIIGKTICELIGEHGYVLSRPYVEKVLNGETVSFERRSTVDGPPRYLAVTYIPMHAADGAIDGFISVAQDITIHKEEEGRLLRLSERDALTGVLNRKGFETFLEQRLADGVDSALALLYIDLDHFKPVNDTHGHPVGDEVLRGFADRLQSLVRPTDAVARLGGDEFAVVLSGIRNKAAADTVADKVVQAAKQPFHVGKLTLLIGASVGVALDRGAGWKTLVAEADEAVYKAKAAGRGRRG